MKKSMIRRKPADPRSHTEAEADAKDGSVQSVNRALTLIETLAEDDEGYRLTTDKNLIKETKGHKTEL